MRERKVYEPKESRVSPLILVARIAFLPSTPTSVRMENIIERESGRKQTERAESS